MSFSLARLVAVLALPLVAACGAPPRTEGPPATLPGYEAVQDGEFLIPAVDPKYLVEGNTRTEVAYTADDPPNSIVVDVFARKLYWVMEGGRAVRYGIAVGREGLTFKGRGYVGRKREWPSWQPTANMIRSRPDLYAAYAGGLSGGLENPLGARALYLYRGGRDTMFRIHGTIENSSIGRATSAGCIRLFNQDAMDLYARADTGTRVKVRSLDESLAIEGPMMDDAFGRVVPETPEAIAQRERELVEIAEYEKREAERQAKEAEEARIAAEKAEKKRLSSCKRKGIAAEDCPVLETAAAETGATNG
ncbi:L,D-transpeptidase [Rhodobacter sp. Har01]|uniref:L,D-transpeptidase n=1 Tax=Rhodobacter sp. Har01 TaxID=2883999 RepID=UPI001D08B37F|nr:L,D-transpeptidase [Rhodobacter sp. Har01]MCB6179497.1 L,D-transpeptidase [Rhodobacter sp. Har01]